MVTGIGRTLIPLDLDSQGQFIALTNAIEMQLESRVPVPDIVRLLGDALLALARARDLPQATRTDLAQRISALNTRVSSTAAKQVIRSHRFGVSTSADGGRRAVAVSPLQTPVQFLFVEIC